MRSSFVPRGFFFNVKQSNKKPLACKLLSSKFLKTGFLKNRWIVFFAFFLIGKKKTTQQFSTAFDVFEPAVFDTFTICSTAWSPSMAFLWLLNLFGNQRIAGNKTVFAFFLAIASHGIAVKLIFVKVA